MKEGEGEKERRRNEENRKNVLKVVRMPKNAQKTSRKSRPGKARTGRRPAKETGKTAASMTGVEAAGKGKAVKPAGKAAPAKAGQKSSSQKGSDKTARIIMWVMIFFVVVFGFVLWLKYGPGSSNPAVLYENVLKGKETADSYMYNGFVFVRDNNLWYSKLQKGSTVYNVPFHYGPREVENISISGNPIAFGRTVIDEYGGGLYITFDPTAPDLKYVALANGELSFNTVKTFGFTPVAGCTKNETQGCIGAPIVSCETTDAPVIYLTQEGDAGIFQSGNCLVVQGRGNDLVRAADRLLYLWYGIMKA
jgi:hypothetical protein